MKRSVSLLIALALASTSSTQAGLITDPLGVNVSGVNPATLPPLPLPAKPAQQAVVDFATATKKINDLIGAKPEGDTVHLSELMVDPEVREALHATGNQADELRGYMDWLLLTGVVIGLDGDDGLDDLTGDPEDGLYSDHGDDEVNADHANGVILGGPGNDNLHPQAPVNGYVFGTTSYMTGAPQAPVNGIILGGPGGDTVQPLK